MPQIYKKEISQAMRTVQTEITLTTKNVFYLSVDSNFFMDVHLYCLYFSAKNFMAHDVICRLWLLLCLCFQDVIMFKIV